MRTSRTLPAFLSCLVLPLTLVGCGGGDGDAAAPAPAAATVTTITVGPADASLSVGQTQAIEAQARDRNGAVIAGVSFTWASSNTGVASVTAGVVTGVAVGSADISASSGGVTSNLANVTIVAAAPAAGSVAIDKPMAFFSQVGQSAPLSAQARDAQGAPSAADVVWTSSAPDKVSVDGAGRVTARAIGSAQIFAQVGSVRSPPTLVLVAEPKSGTLLLTDSQIVSVGPPLRLAAGESPGIGSEYEVMLQGVAAPAVGSLVIATESAPVAGRVVATRQEPAGPVLTLALAPLHELFRAYDIALTIELSAFALQAVPDRMAVAANAAVWSQAVPAKRLAAARVRPLDAFDPFQAWKCEASLKPQLIGEPIQLTLDNKLTLVLEDRPGYSKHALEGSAAIVGSAGLKLKAGFKAAGRCDAQGQIKLPVFGWFSALVMPGVRFGLGAEVEGEVLLVQADVGVEGRVSFNPVLGWECGGATPACRGLDSIALTDNFKTKSRFPTTTEEMQAKVSAHFFVVAGLDAVIGLGLANATIVEGRVGPKQSFDLGFEKGQAAAPGYAASYDLKLEAVVEPGEALTKAIEKVIGDDSTTVKFKAEASTDISESPKGTLSVGKTKVRPGEAVDFSVDLDPKTVAYWVLGYNVTGVELYRRRADETEFTHWKSMDLNASHRATYRWVPDIVDLGSQEFAAFVNTQVLTPLLEVAPNSVQAVEVSCFGAGTSATTSSRPSRLQATRRSGARSVALATTSCADTWVGTAATGSIPDGSNHTVAQLTLKVDDRVTGNAPGQVFYYAEGSVKVKLGPGWPAGCTMSPTEIPITRETGSPGSGSETNQFEVNYSTSPPTVGGVGAVSALTTISCPASTTTSMWTHSFATIPSGTPLSADGLGFAGVNEPFYSFSFRRP